MINLIVVLEVIGLLFIIGLIWMKIQDLKCQKQLIKENKEELDKLNDNSKVTTKN